MKQAELGPVYTETEWVLSATVLYRMDGSFTRGHNGTTETEPSNEKRVPRWVDLQTERSGGSNGSVCKTPSGKVQCLTPKPVWGIVFRPTQPYCWAFRRCCNSIFMKQYWEVPTFTFSLWQKFWCDCSRSTDLESITNCLKMVSKPFVCVRK